MILHFFIYIVSILILIKSIYALLINKKINIIIKISIILYSTLWVVIPSVITIFFRKYYVGDLSEKIYTKYATLEILFNIVIFFLFTITVKKSNWKSELINTKIKINGILIISYLFNLYYFFFSKFSQSTYLDINDVSSITADVTILGLIQTFALLIIFYHVLISIFQRRYNLYFYLSLSIIIFSTIQNLLAGSRIAYLSLIFIFIVYFYAAKNTFNFKKIIIYLLAISIVFISILSLKTLEVLRQANAKIDIQTLYVLSQQSNDNNTSDAFITVLSTKLNSISYGALLVEGDGLGKAGIKPYIGALFSPIPSFIYRHKPLSGSYNGTITGIPSRHAAYLDGYDPDIANVGVSASGVSLWQLGYLGLIITIILNIINLNIINRLLQSPNLFLKYIVGLYFLYIPTFILIQSGDALIKGWLQCFVVYCLILFFYKVTKKKNSQTANNH